MDQTVQAFLDKPSLDANDIQAKRAIIAFAKLERLAQNFADCGRTVLLHNASNGANAALHGFACINACKSYPFADKVSSIVPDLTDLVKDIQGADYALLAEDPIDFAEAVELAYREYYSPVATIAGVDSARILRGDHALAAMVGMHIANDH